MTLIPCCTFSPIQCSSENMYFPDKRATMFEAVMLTYSTDITTLSMLFVHKVVNHILELIIIIRYSINSTLHANNCTMNRSILFMSACRQVELFQLLTTWTTIN